MRRTDIRDEAGAIALVVAVIAALVAVDPAGLAPFGPLRWAVVPGAVLAAVAASGTWRVARRPAVAWVALLALVALAAAVGLDPLYAWIGTPERHFGAATWLLCALAFVAAQQLGPRGDRLVVGALVIGAGVIGAWSLAEVLGWEPIRLVGAGDRAVGPLGSSAYLGAAATLLLPVAVAWRGRVAMVVAALVGVALVASGARAAWVGVAVAGVVVLLRRDGRGRTAALLGGAVVAAIAVAALVGVADRAGDVASDDAGGARGRLDEWRVAVHVIADHPLTGVGPEGYRIAFGAAVDDRYEQEHGRAQLPDRAHSAPLDVLATTGVGGVLAYLALLACVGAFVIRALRGDDAIARGLALGLVAYAAQSPFLFPVAELEPVAWTMAGLLVARTARDGEWARVRVGIVARSVVVTLALATVVVGARDVVADRRAKDVLAGATGDPHGAAALRPDAVRYHLVEARVREQDGDLDGAAAALADALRVSPLDPRARSEQARVLLEIGQASGDLAAARRTLETLAQDDPRNAEVLLRLGVVRALDGDLDGAEAAWRDAARLAPDSTAATTNLARLREQRERDGT